MPRSSKPDASRTVLDHSWLANDRLWDAYWFSTMSTLQGKAYTGASSMTRKALADQFFAGTKSLPNKRNIAYQPPGKPATDASTDALTVGGRKIGGAHHDARRLQREQHLGARVDRHPLRTFRGDIPLTPQA